VNNAHGTSTRDESSESDEWRGARERGTRTSNLCEQRLHSPRYNSRFSQLCSARILRHTIELVAEHTEGLAAARLSVCDDGGIITHQHVVDQRLADRIVHLLLSGVGLKHAIERERVRFAATRSTAVYGQTHSRPVIARELDGCRQAALLLCIVLGTEADNHLNVLSGAARGTGRRPAGCSSRRRRR
jgi:hypothetical protein